MTKRSMVLAAVAALLIPLSPAQRKPMPNPRANSAYEKDRQASIQMNELAGHIHSLEDARRLVNMVAKQFPDELAPEWATAGIRERIAEAEYRSATNPAELIPEERVADAWNRYVDEIGAPEEALVTAAEIHNMRDADYATVRFFWTRVNQSVWTMPNIYAVGPDGKVADGCRALESVEMVWRMANYYQDIGAARERVQKGIVVSDLMKKEQKARTSSHVRGEVRFSVRPENPLEAAERRYVREHGAAGQSRVIVEMMGNLFPEG